MDLCEALQRALFRVEVETLDDVLERYTIRELALMWLGLNRIPRQGTDSWRNYRTARRLFERYRAGLGRAPRGGRQTRAPRDVEEFLDRLRERIERRRPPAGKSLTITITGEVRVSKDRRHRTIREELDGECIGRIVDALEDEDCDAAEDAFEECFGEASGMGAVPHWTDVEALVAR